MNYKGKAISTIEDLKKNISNWQEGKSAATLGKFVFHGGLERIEGIVNDIFSVIRPGTNIQQFDCIDFEHETKFDKFGNGRMHDLALWGSTNCSDRFFVGIEAKVNEPFDSRDIQSAYLSGLLRRANGEKSNLPDRIESLIRRNNFKQNNASKRFTKDNLKLKYQLLFSTIGTISEDADFYIFLVLVFHTKIYDDIKGVQNYHDFIAFMNAITSRNISRDKNLYEIEVYADDKLENKKKMYAAYVSIV